MNRQVLSAALACGLLVAGCGPSADIEAEKAALMELSRQWSALIEAGDIENGMQYWAEDAMMLPPEFPVLRGREAIGEYVAGASEIPGFGIRWEPIEAQVSASGDMAWMLERNVITLDGPDGAPIVNHNKVLTVWRKDDEGNWRNVADMWNAAPGPE